ncbi:Periplasmic protein TonB [Pseudomonas chlororaphis subsp. aureofaciens]|uniref:DUF3577 domain-containing protein n=1 Tax=Pseudomonas chlororaphis TaxID=587753 RepID=UPI000F6C1B77|nr:DUF3577 domain-containing protein [Pseudomonas chlororaphis]AZD86821.1 Periplasmic protein TonB [Pseudomonas chlororaphis subsp. aureofaciens]
MTTSSQSNEKSYFDVHTTGLGFLKRIREVIPGGRKRDAFLACAISALTGTGDKPTYRYLDVRVSGSKAQELVRSHAADVEAGRPVLIQFRVGDTFSDVFVRTSGDRAGMPDATLKGRLLTAAALDLSVLQQMVQHRLETRGLGYINRIVRSQRDPLLRHCSLAMLNGSVDEPVYRYIDIDAIDPIVVALLDRYSNDVRAKRKVLVSFRLGDLEASFFTRTKGENAGEHSPLMKSTLNYIGTIKVDGQESYRDPSKITQSDVSHENAEAASEVTGNNVPPADTPQVDTPVDQASEQAAVDNVPIAEVSKPLAESVA